MGCGSTGSRGSSSSGSGVGSGVGTGVGLAVGLGVGLAVGSGVGLAVGSGVGLAVGLGVGSGVGVGSATTGVSDVPGVGSLVGWGLNAMSFRHVSRVPSLLVSTAMEPGSHTVFSGCSGVRVGSAAGVFSGSTVGGSGSVSAVGSAVSVGVSAVSGGGGGGTVGSGMVSGAVSTVAVGVVGAVVGVSLFPLPQAAIKTAKRAQKANIVFIVETGYCFIGGMGVRTVGCGIGSSAGKRLLTRRNVWLGFLLAD